MKNLFKILPFLILSFFIFFYSKDISENIISVINIWKNNLVPSLFPFLIVSKFLINYNIPFRLFNLNPGCSFIFIMSMLSGFPSSAKYTKDLLSKNVISPDDANRIMLFSHFANPAFVLITLGSNFLKQPNVGYLILFSHYFSNVIIGFFVMFGKSNKRINYSFKSEPFNVVLNSSIREAMSTLFLILGTLITYSIVITVFNKLPINFYYKTILSGLLELTSGLKGICLLDISLRLKAAISSMLLSFGGLAIHTQITSIYNINYFKFLKFRILQAIISFFITYFLFNLIYHL